MCKHLNSIYKQIKKNKNNTDNKAEIVGSETREDNYKRLILSWIGTCPG